MSSGGDKPAENGEAKGTSKASDSTEEKAADKEAESDEVTASVQETKSKVFEFLLLEDRDEFEEFAADEPNPDSKLNELLPQNLWSDNWADEELEDDFSTVLKAEYKALGKAWTK